jgi:choline dehydrogenase-like flavoprotein
MAVDETDVASVDVAIVGAGACGALVASKLSQRRFSVVILEAG